MYGAAPLELGGGVVTGGVGRGVEGGVWVRTLGPAGRADDAAAAEGELVTSGLAGDPNEDGGGVRPGALVRPAPPCATVRAAAESAAVLLLVEGVDVNGEDDDEGVVPLLTGRVTSCDDDDGEDVEVVAGLAGAAGSGAGLADDDNEAADDDMDGGGDDTDGDVDGDAGDDDDADGATAEEDEDPDGSGEDGDVPFLPGVVVTVGRSELAVDAGRGALEEAGRAGRVTSPSVVFLL